MTARNKIIAAAAAVVVVFLIGFVPQFRKARAMRSELATGQERIASLEMKLKQAELRDLMGLAYLETNRKNFGTARQYSTEFFTKAPDVAAGTSDPALAGLLQEIQQRRDELTAGLAQARPEIRQEIEDIFLKLYENTRKY
ncbi:MAG: hypothetical protein KIT09_13440 [Bryobacteraceae bacterium]|nr:hypothetical protein [Bryobacteraceae bacterium]